MNPRFDSLDPARGGRSFAFHGRVGEVVAWDLDGVAGALEEVERAVRDGAHAAGFVAYEAAPAFDRALAAADPKPDLPLLQFGLYAERKEIEPLAGLPPGGGYELDRLEPSITRERYDASVRRILDLIGAGDTYQVNYTFRMRGGFRGDPLAFYGDLCRSQRSAFCAYLDAGRYQLISASPELFVRCDGRRVEMRPMKGTRPRGRWSAEDEVLAAELTRSAKERAENLMIVDLLRNDLGRIAEYGTVGVPTLFEVERYPTVHQLTSTVVAELRAGVGPADVFAALFPSGSVTGAPKIRTSEIIRELEDSPRGVYTGAIGFISPDEAAFSVAIRTAVLDSAGGVIEVGVGSGITADSTARAEYDECIAKGVFIGRRRPEFALLESLRLEEGSYPLLSDHLSRLRSSAAYFGYRFPERSIRDALEATAGSNPAGVHKVRLRLDRAGAVVVDVEAIPARMPPARVAIAALPIDETDPFLYHKTTYREAYERALAEGGDVDDVILVNRRGELTEATRANLVVRLDGRLVTPPVESGLLAGVMRQRLIDGGEVSVSTLKVEDLRRATAVYLVSSVRGWREAWLVDGAGVAAVTGGASTSATRRDG